MGYILKIYFGTKDAAQTKTIEVFKSKKEVFWPRGVIHHSILNMKKTKFEYFQELHVCQEHHREITQQLIVLGKALYCFKDDKIIKDY